MFKVTWLVEESRYLSASQGSEDKWNRVCKKQDERQGGCREHAKGKQSEAGRW